jgi:hypothetical protein
MSGVYPTPPMTPRPPASDTAAASLGPAATFIPARKTVHVVRSCSGSCDQYTVLVLCIFTCDYLRGEAMM